MGDNQNSPSTTMRIPHRVASLKDVTGKMMNEAAAEFIIVSSRF
jgi:hypothetical protein